MMILIALLQLAPACPGPIQVQPGHVADCRGVLMPGGDLDELDVAIETCERRRKADAQRLAVCSEAGESVRGVLQPLAGVLAIIYEGALDRSTVRVVEAPTPPPVTWWDRPGWPTVIVGGVLAFAAGGVTAWAVR